MKTTKQFSPDVGNVNPVRQRLAGLSALIAFAALAACGGGGGGDSTPPVAGPAPAPAPTTPPAPAPSPAPAPAPAASVTINSVGACVMQTTSCELRVSFDAKATTNAKAYVLNYAGDQTVLNGDGQTLVFNITGAKPDDVLTVVFEDSTGKQLASASADTSCVAGALWYTMSNPSGECTKKLSSYNEAVIALMGPNATIYSVDRNSAAGAVQAVDKTGWTVPNENGWLPPPAKCALRLRDNPDPIGIVVFACTDPATVTYRLVGYNPVSKEMKSYGTGVVDPATFTTDNYVDVSPYSPLYPGWAHYLEVTAGYYFIYDGEAASQFEIWFQPKGSPLPSPVKIYTDPAEFGYNTNIKAFFKFSYNNGSSQ